MSAIQFIGTTPTDLIQEIKKEIIPELKEQLKEEFQPKEPTSYLTRNEVCEMLHIDLSTLHRWRKEGTLIAYGLGNRIYFKRNEIDEFINRNRL
ncbi:helix-turn-helix domain-containing protein [Chryseobacterium daecheongense]|uniref:helix-turn-helix domain-containing protein n=1 Tax=Chryseobacterium daecheongense TaxID=192389 RepID=UPI001FD6EBFD|nr:helix-turn-helix domain-containing protein [Chryseobacterium daecheongense]UOU98989.1 helix-turn-helix domain-containing protein [Chryseobacterium daecheongense]